jgi:hypothetical protein
MRKIALSLIASVAALALAAPASHAQPPAAVAPQVPLSWLETGGRVFAGGGTALTNGIFFPGTLMCSGTDCSGLPPVQIQKGTDLEFVNLDVAAVTNAHQIMSYKRKRGRAAFASKAVEGPDTEVIITSHLKPGIYRFFCATHFGMEGAIEIVR